MRVSKLFTLPRKVISGPSDQAIMEHAVARGYVVFTHNLISAKCWAAGV